MLDKELNYYISQRHKFLEMYDGKFIVIKNAKVIGVYNTHTDAYEEAKKVHEVGTFIIKNPRKKDQ
jgi:hypothetical protein